MDKITRIEFENYKCFDKKVELKDIKPINVIIGRNNIGKSSILDIIEMMIGIIPVLSTMNQRLNLPLQEKLPLR